MVGYKWISMLRQAYMPAAAILIKPKVRSGRILHIGVGKKVAFISIILFEKHVLNFESERMLTSS
jgi:hypothetical protein